MLVTFEGLLMPEELRQPSPLPARWMRTVIADMNSPLMWQRQTDIYVAVVRHPDRPHLRLRGDRVELIPGENHWETRGYDLLRDGIRITEDLIRPGEVFALPAEGSYAAVSVEWSGLRSPPSRPVRLNAASDLHVLADRPGDFSWTRDRYLADGREVSSEEATRTANVVREIIHLHDGVIHQEWYRNGKLSQRHDLNSDGKAIRRLFYEDGTLTRREYHDRDGGPISTERFDKDGYITESIHGRNHWWYERGAPVRFTNGKETYFAAGDSWQRQRESP
jgi:hypothetical protein